LAGNLIQPRILDRRILLDIEPGKEIPAVLVAKYRKVQKVAAARFPTPFSVYFLHLVNINQVKLSP